MGTSLVDLPMKFLLPSSFDNVKEIAFKTTSCVSKAEIKRLLQSMYGFEIEKVRTLNMQGKTKRFGSRLVSRPNYKKAYVTLKNPISVAPLLYGTHAIGRERDSSHKQSESKYLQEEAGVSSWVLDSQDIQPEHQVSEKESRGLRTIGTLGMPDL